MFVQANAEIRNKKKDYCALEGNRRSTCFIYTTFIQGDQSESFEVHRITFTTLTRARKVTIQIP